MQTRALSALLPAFFAFALFLSAGLLFLLEPMIAKMILPLLGGTPAVWNTCMMFFQAVLLAGYGYAHVSSRLARLNHQIIIHLALFLVGLAVMPVAVSSHWLPPAEGSPIGYMLLLLLISIGLPFFALSATSLLLQKWFSDTGHPSAVDPYFLYSASNLGSMLALIGYPTLLEPHLRLHVQSLLWTAGYLLLMAMILISAWLTWKYRSRCSAPGLTDGGSLESSYSGNSMISSSFRGSALEDACLPDDSKLSFMQRCRWVILAFVPSSLMLGVTTFLSTDIAAIPLFWIVPLSLYLFSFIIVFARVPAAIHKTSVYILPITVTALIFVTYSNVDIPKWVVFIFHLANFFVYCMVCHGEIARSRPATTHLTEFYLWVSVGGVLGGTFNALIAPVVFDDIIEYPLVIVLGALLLPAGTSKYRQILKSRQDIIMYFGVALVLVFLTYWATVRWPVARINTGWLAGLLHAERGTLDLIITYGLLGLICYGLFFLKKPLLFGIGVAALLMTIVVSKDMNKDIAYRERSFFGVLMVTRDLNGDFTNLYHGTTIHGKQWRNPEKWYEPVAYYHEKGPAGRVFSEFSGERKKSRIAITGLGVGTLAAYAGPGQEIDFYEIDPTVKKISTNPFFFSYLQQCRAEWRIVLGDARLTMAKAPPHHYGVIVLDAFSSDAIPVHLITKEAVDMYFSKLEKDGVLLAHISNKYVDLAPVLGKLAADKGYIARISDDDEEIGDEKYVSTWVLMARNETDLGGLAGDSGWKEIGLKKKVAAWTDDFSNILSVFKWN